MLYRCSVIIRLIINYHSNTARKASLTRLDLHCQKMEFSITEQQVPMLLRLAALIMALHTKQFPSSKEKSSTSVEEREDNMQGLYYTGGYIFASHQRHTFFFMIQLSYRRHGSRRWNCSG